MYQNTQREVTSQITNEQPTSNQQITNEQPQYNNNNKYNKNNKVVVDNKELEKNDVKKISDCMLKTLNTTNTNNILECITYLDELPYEVIEYALKKTARIQQPSWKYATRILEDYVRKKIVTVEQAQADDMNYQSLTNKCTTNLTQEEKRAQMRKALEKVEEESKNGY